MDGIFTTAIAAPKVAGLLAVGASSAAEMAFWPIFFQLLILLSAALLLGMVFERLGQSAILGYLLAGALVGPAVLGAVHADSGVPVIAELGVSMLLFAVGLEFSARRLLSLGGIALGGGSLQVVLTLAAGAGTAAAFGFALGPSLAIGAMVALSSTACVLRILIDRGEIDSVHGRTALGILLMQDIAVVPLVLLVTMLGGAGSLAEMGTGFARAGGVIVALVAGFYLLSNFVLPRLLKSLSLSRDRELLILLAAVLAMGSAGAAHAVGISPALGAFIAGIMLAESPFATQIRSDISALRALFIALFFASVGMLADPGWIARHAGQVALVVALFVIGKALIITAITSLFRLAPKYAVATGVSLAQVGEFGVVIAGIAYGDGLLDGPTFQLLVSATLISLFLTPFLLRAAVPMGRAFEKWLPTRNAADRAADAADETGPLSGHVIVVGFGPAGQRVAEELADQGRETLVLDLRPANVELAEAAGFAAALGDSTHLDVLLHHGISRARAIIITVPDHRAASQITAAVRHLAPDIRIIARARYHNAVAELERPGGIVVVDEEFVIGEQLAEAVRAACAEADGATGAIIPRQKPPAPVI